MAEIRKGLRHILARPAAYDLFQAIVGANAWRKRVLERFLADEIQANSLVVDIGCGTGEILSYLPASICYLGIDRNPNYIARAKRKYHWRQAQFLCQELSLDLAVGESKAHVVLAIGLLHHLEDSECIELFQAAKKILRPDGFFLALDPVYHQAQSLAARYIISKDRGRDVRTKEQYLSLYEKAFGHIDCYIDFRPLRIPYTGIVARCRI